MRFALKTGYLAITCVSGRLSSSITKSRRHDRGKLLPKSVDVVTRLARNIGEYKDHASGHDLTSAIGLATKPRKMRRKRHP